MTRAQSLYAREMLQAIFITEPLGAECAWHMICQAHFNCLQQLVSGANMKHVRYWHLFPT
eukprot:566603-Amphidinium_carterae.1